MSKLANILFARELQVRFDAQNIPIIATSIHPGFVRTEGNARTARDGPALIGSMFAWLLNYFALSPTQGSYTTLFAGTSPKIKADAERFKGAYIVPFGRVEKGGSMSRDVAGLGKDLWKCSEELMEICLRDDAST